MQEQLMGQLAQLLRERVGLDAEKAQQAVQVVAEFAQQHASELVQMAAGGGEGGGLQGLLGNENVQGAIGKMFGR